GRASSRTERSRVGSRPHLVRSSSRSAGTRRARNRDGRRAVTESSYLVAVRTEVRSRVRTRKTAIFLSRRADSNCRPAVYETAALPAELRRRVFANDFGTSLTTKRGLRKLPLHCLTLLRLFSLDKSTRLSD